LKNKRDCPDFPGQTTTAAAKQAEKNTIQQYYKETGKIPVGNQKSFKP
jgi:hypothetical protein